MTTYKTLNTETTNKNGIEIVVTTIEKTINTMIPFVKTYFTMTVNGNSVGPHELQQRHVDFYTKNSKMYS